MLESAPQGMLGGNVRNISRLLLISALMVATVCLIALPHRRAAAAHRPAAPGQSAALTLLSQIGGATDGLAIQGDRLYAGVGPRLVVLDIADATHPRVLGDVMLSGRVTDVAVSGQFAYVAADYAGLQVVDVGDPAAPLVVGSLLGPHVTETWGVYLDSGRVYLAEVTDVTSQLTAVDVSNPAMPRALGVYEPASGYLSGAFVVASRAYLTDGDDLFIVDFTDPAHPSDLGTYATPGEAQGVWVTGGRAYVNDVIRLTDFDYAYSMLIVDVTDGTAPKPVSSYAVVAPEVLRGIVVAGTTAYLSLSDAVRILNVQDPVNVTDLGQLELIGGPSVLTVAGTRLAIGQDSGGFVLVDAANPATPRIVGSYVVPGSPDDVTVSGDRAYLAEGYFAAGLRLLGVADPAHPATQGFVDTPGQAARVAVSGTTAYVADWGEGLQIVDAADPAAPRIVGNYQAPDEVKDVAVRGPRAYLAVSTSGLRILDVTNPTNPRELGGFDLPGVAWGIQVNDTTAYVAEVDQLQVLDITDASAPKPLGSFAVEATEGQMSLVGTRLYVASSIGLQVLDVSQPATVREVGHVSLARGGNDVAVVGNTAFVTTELGVEAIDLGSLTVVAEYLTPTLAEGVAAAGGDVFVAADQGGLYILQYSGSPVTPTPSPSITPGVGPTPPTATPSGPGPYRLYLPYGVKHF
jgi:hypothetical protein